jgi:two-component system response regulator VanR
LYSKTLNKLKHYTLLFVEDEQGIRENLQEYFSLMFQEVFVACDGVEALEIFHEESIDLVITDLKMPNMTGIELVKEIRKEDQITDIIITSAHTDVEFLLSSIPLGLVDYVVKPLTEEKIMTVLEKFANTKTIALDEKDFSTKELKFLEVFGNQNRVITYDEIEQHIWGDKFMSQNALRVFIKNLRKKLPEDAIKNVSNQGYMVNV